MKQKIKNIFKDKPPVWGLRGDPYLWDELEKLFSDSDYSISPSEFSKRLDDAFEKLIKKGKINGNNKDFIYFEHYPQGGMSGGYVDKQWWLKQGLPLLKKRFLAVYNRKKA